MTPQTVVMTSGVMTPQQGGMTPSYQQHSTIIQQPHGVSMQMPRGQLDQTATSIGQPQLNSTAIQGTAQQISYHDASQQNLLQSQLQAQMQQQAAIQQQEFQLQQQQAYNQQQTVASSPMAQQQQGFIQQQQMYDPNFHQNIQQTQSPFHGQYQN